MHGLEIQDLFVESRKYPLGIDTLQPSLSWSFKKAGRRGSLQTAYRVLVATCLEYLNADKGDVWDSGIVNSARCVSVLYGGSPLRSRTRYYWKVMVWNDQDQQTESGIAWWEMGLLRPEDWAAKWIESSMDIDASATQFRQDFELPKAAQRARIYVCGLGQYELYLDGQKVGDHVLEPGWTNYEKTRLYSVFDVSKQLTSGAHAVGLLLGNGFYHVEGGRYTKHKGSFGKPRCIVQLNVEFEDGTSMVVGTNEEWWASKSPLSFSDVYGGEDYDARLIQPGWASPGFADVDWGHAVAVQDGTITLKSQQIPPLKVMKRFEPVDITETRPGVYIVDFGQNFSGWVRVQMKGPAGAQLELTPCEMLKDGLADQRHTGSPYKWTYTLSGSDSESWTPKFSYYGFRYVQVEGLVPIELSDGQRDAGQLLHMEGQMIYPDTGVVGAFRCSDPMINRVHEIILLSVLSNMKSVFTDCPHREKLGWLEQTHLMGPAIMFNYDLESIFSKVLLDMRDAQLPNGMIPSTAPEYTVFTGEYHHFRDTVGWGIAYILLPWYMNQKYGNRQVLSEHYDGMKKYVEYIRGRSEDLIVTGGLGDWYDVGENPPGYAQNTSVELVETAMFYHMVDIMSSIAVVLGHSVDVKAYEHLASQIRAAFYRRFVKIKPFTIGTGSQTAYALPLTVGLLNDEHTNAALSKLVQDIEGRGYKITAGDIGHRYVLLALHQYGYTSVIHKMLSQTDEPGYGYQVVLGATTLTEAWDGPSIGKSQNHFMLGHIEEWFYHGVAGIDYYFDTDEEIFRFTVKPDISRNLGWIHAHHTVRPGTMSVNVQRYFGQQVSMKVVVPANTGAIVYIPTDCAGDIQEQGVPLQQADGITLLGIEGPYVTVKIGPGEYFFTYSMPVSSHSRLASITDFED